MVMPGRQQKRYSESDSDGDERSAKPVFARTHRRLANERRTSNEQIPSAARDHRHLQADQHGKQVARQDEGSMQKLDSRPHDGHAKQPDSALESVRPTGRRNGDWRRNRLHIKSLHQYTQACLERPESRRGRSAKAVRKIAAPSHGCAAFEELISMSTTTTPAADAVPTNRAGLRDGQVSELTVIAPLKEGGAAKLRAIFASQGGRFTATDKVGSVHDMRFVFLDNDTKLLFATAYDGDWDSYINDFATLIPDALDVVFSHAEGWPGVRSPEVKDYIAKYQITASAWYVAVPEATVPMIKRGLRIATALEALLDAAN
jgi:hypothetical protein